MTCPDCGSDRTKREGFHVWTVYVFLIVLAIPAVLLLKLNAGIVAGVIIAAAVLTNLVLNQRVCLDCGHQWRRRDDKPN